MDEQGWQFKSFAILPSRTFLLLPSSHCVGFNNAGAGWVGRCCTFWRARAANGTTSIVFHHQKRGAKMKSIVCSQAHNTSVSWCYRRGDEKEKKSVRRHKAYQFIMHLTQFCSNNTSFSDYSLHVNNLIQRQAVAYTACSHWICISDCTEDKHVI